MTALPRPGTPEGRAGLDALLAAPEHALVAADFDGTLSPIVDRPDEARAHPGALPALTALAAAVGTVAVITGRPRPTRSAWAGWRPSPAWSCSAITAGSAGRTAASPPPLRRPGWTRPGPRCLACWPRRVRRTAPGSRTRRTRWPCTPAARPIRTPRWPGSAVPSASWPGLGLAAEPGRFVIELRPPGVDKGAALTSLVRERAARSVLFCGDDLGDLPAFAAVRALRERGVPGCAVASASPESPQVAAAADLVVDGPDGVVDLLAALAAELGHAGRPVR